MGSLFNLDNPIWRFMGKLVDVFILTLLWAVCCIPIITIGPASTAVYYVTLKLVRDEVGTLTMENRFFIAGSCMTAATAAITAS